MRIAAALAFLLAAAPAFAGHGKSHGHDHDQDGQESKHASHEHGKTFHDDERAEIERFYETHPGERDQLPPGLAKKGKVPPGWRKKLARGQRVSDDLWELRLPLPHDILVKLPPPPPGVVIVRIHDQVVRAIERTHEVLDVLGLPHPPTPR
ncbi:MAG TPA: hypothetical protein VM369_04825 [Candidatus Binatia bacterium]|nr:hypothetical protein [Candidatus Binatia bacterium]